jgi:urease alpha subunit
VSGFVLIMSFVSYLDDFVFMFCENHYLFAACTPGPGHVEMMLRATDDLPLNFGFSGKGNTSDASSLKDVLRAGAAGFKLHEDWGTVRRISLSFLLQ